jgi:hypothetical protein
MSEQPEACAECGGPVGWRLPDTIPFRESSTVTLYAYCLNDRVHEVVPGRSGACDCESGHALLCPVHAEEAIRLMRQLTQQGQSGAASGADLHRTALDRTGIETP